MNPFGDTEMSSPADTPSWASPASHLSQHEQLIQEQDDMLDILGESVMRQQRLASAIGQETDEQLSLLDNIGSHVDYTSLRVNQENVRMENFSTKSSTKCLWAIIIVLVLALITTIVLAETLPPLATTVPAGSAHTTVVSLALPTSAPTRSPTPSQQNGGNGGEGYPVPAVPGAT